MYLCHHESGLWGYMRTEESYQAPGACLIIEVMFKVTAAAAKAEHGSDIGQQAVQSSQEVLVEPGDVAVAQLHPAQASG